MPITPAPSPIPPAAGMIRLYRLLTLLLLTPIGCAATFSADRAVEVTREQLLALSEKEKSEHLVYVGSDRTFHYVCDVRAGQEKSYKVRTDSMKLADTFTLGSGFDEPYVLYPWVVEGKPLGRKPDKQ